MHYHYHFIIIIIVSIMYMLQYGSCRRLNGGRGSKYLKSMPQGKTVTVLDTRPDVVITCGQSAMPETLQG